MEIGKKLFEKKEIKESKFNYINPKAYEMIKEDIAFWIDNKGDFEAGKAIGEVLNTLIYELGLDYDPTNEDGYNHKKLIRFKNGLKNTL